MKRVTAGKNAEIFMKTPVVPSAVAFVEVEGPYLSQDLWGNTSRVAYYTFRFCDINLSEICVSSDHAAVIL